VGTNASYGQSMPPRPLDVRIGELRTQPGRTWGPADALLAVLGVPLALAVVVGLVGIGLRLPEPTALVVASAALGALAYVVGRRAAAQSGGWGAALGLDLPEWHDAWRVLGWTGLLMLAQLAAVSALLLAVPALQDVEPETNVDFIVDAPLGSLLLFAVLTVTVAPVVEELLFRGVALRGFMLRMGFWPAALLSTAFFSLLHVQRLAAGSMFVLVAIGTLGLGLCVLTRRTGRLGPSIGVHALYNASVFLFTVLTT
jgi:uncharacterized protein